MPNEYDKKMSKGASMQDGTDDVVVVKKQDSLIYFPNLVG